MFDAEQYYEDFLRYAGMAKIQQTECNLGAIPHPEGQVQDPLMQKVTLYDVTNRRYAGFGQLLNDLWYGDTSEHPYSHKLHDVRQPIAKSFNGVHLSWDLEEWLYVFLTHRVTGSAIDYKLKYAGYGPSILPELYRAWDLEDMPQVMEEFLPKTKCYTSVGYQFCAFPKNPSGGRGGDYYLTHYAPRLVKDLAEHLRAANRKPTFRELGEWMAGWNKSAGLRVYHFQHAAFLADIADYYPDFIDASSPFFYGTNAVECISYFTGGKRSTKALDSVVEKACDQLGGLPYDVEDIFCDYIRYVENYVRPGDHYDSLCRDSVWNTSLIKDHPYGRQKKMLELGLIDSFNKLKKHPADDFVIREAGIDAHTYKKMCIK